MAARPDKKAPSPPDLSHPLLRTWLEAPPQAGGGAKAAPFETGFKLSPGGAAGKILKMMEAKGYRPDE